MSHPHTIRDGFFGLRSVLVSLLHFPCPITSSFRRASPSWPLIMGASPTVKQIDTCKPFPLPHVFLLPLTPTPEAPASPSSVTPPSHCTSPKSLWAKFPMTLSLSGSVLGSQSLQQVTLAATSFLRRHSSPSAFVPPGYLLCSSSSPSPLPQPIPLIFKYIFFNLYLLI